jgi:hypothetical protein
LSPQFLDIDARMSTPCAMDASLPEELLLIAYNATTGWQGGATELGCGLAGAVLVELTLAGRIDVVDGRMQAVDATPTGDPVLDDAPARIATSKKIRKPDWWVGTLAATSTLATT